MSLSRTQILENLQSLGEQGASFEVAAEYLKSINQNPDDFFQSTQPSVDAVVEETNGLTDELAQKNGELSVSANIPQKPIPQMDTTIPEPKPLKLEKKETPLTEPKDIVRLRQTLEASQKFDETVAGKFLNKFNQAVDFIVPGDQPSLTEELQTRLDRRLKQQRAGKEKWGRYFEDLGEDNKQILSDTAEFVPYTMRRFGLTKYINNIGKLKPQLNKTVIKKGLKSLVEGTTEGLKVSGSQLASQLIKGEDPEKTVEDAAKAGVDATLINLGLAATPTGIKFMADKLAPVTKKSSAFISEIFSSIPQETYTRAMDKLLEGKDFFKGKFNPNIFNELGKKARKSRNDLLNIASRKKKIELATLNKITEEFDLKKDLNRYRKLLETKRGKQSIYTAQEKKQIKEILDTIADEDSLIGFDTIVDRLDNEINWKRFPENITPKSPAGEKILKSIRTKLSSNIKKYSKSYEEVKKENKEIAELVKDTESIFKKTAGQKKETVGNNIKQALQDPDKTKSLQRLDELSKKELKFIDEFEDNLARKPFEELFPGTGGGSGSAQGFSNLMRIMLAGSTGVSLSPGAGVGAILATSPKTQKTLLRGATGLVRGVRGLEPYVTPTRRIIPLKLAEAEND